MARSNQKTETLPTMLKPATTAARAPRGTKPVSQAFFSALESIPEASRAAVAKAALTMIRDEMKMRREKLRATAAKQRHTSRAAAPPKPPAKRAPKPEPVTNGAAAPKRRGRKPVADAPVT